MEESMWEIPPDNFQEILILSDEDDITAEPVVGSQNISRVEIVQANNAQKEQTSFGPARLIEQNGDHMFLDLDSCSGSHYVAKVDSDKKLTSAKVGFVSPNILQEKYYFLKRIRVEFRPNPDVEEWRLPVYVPLIRIHRPHRKGCSSKAITQLKEETEKSAEFNFLGINGGGGIGLKTELSSTYSAGSICKEEVIPATLIVEHGAIFVNDEAITYGARYRIVDLDPSQRKTREIPAHIDKCNKPPLHPPEPKPPLWFTFDKTTIPENASDTDSEGVSIGSTGYITVGLGTDAGPLNVSIEMKRTMEWEYKVETNLMGGAKYLRFPVSNSIEQPPFEICWSIME